MSEIIKIVPEVHPHKNRGGLPAIDIFVRNGGERQPTPSQYTQEFSMVPPTPHKVDESLKQRGEAKPPSSLVELMEHQSEMVSPVVAEFIKEAQSVREDKIFLSYHYDRQEYLQEFYMKSGIYSPKATEAQQLIKNLLHDRMEQSQQSILQGIDRNEVVVYKKKELAKEDLAELERIDQARLIKIREGELKSKLDLLNEKMQEIKYFSESSLKHQPIKLPVQNYENIDDQLDYKSFGLDSTKTRLAEEYTIKKKRQRSQRARRKQAILEKEQQEHLRREEERVYNNNILEKEKKDEILNVLQKKRLRLQQQRQKNKQKQEAFMKFLLEYKSKKPLYKQKEEEYRRRYILPLEKSKEERLKEIRQNHRHLSAEELLEHEKNYMQKRQEQSSKREEQMRLMLSNRKKQTKDHYKSHFHELIEEEASAVIDPTDLGHYRSEKRREYGERLKKQHPPAIDENKKKEMADLIKKSERKGKKLKKRIIQLDDRTFDGNLENANVVYEQLKDGDHKKDGLRYLEFARRIGERMKHRLESAKKKDASETKQATQSQELLSVREPKPVKSDRYNKPASEYEAQIRNKRILNSWTDDLKDSRLSQQERLERVRVKSMLIDDKARNKQQLLRFAHFESPLLQIKKKAELDDHYISSIKAKVALLSMGD